MGFKIEKETIKTLIRSSTINIRAVSTCLSLPGLKKIRSSQTGARGDISFHRSILCILGAESKVS